ncbi:FitA-like ribbon-helix-helix domain-containing protein [Nocardia sp. NBC_00416]|uniref:FitA-like ribbon-helix-helix domain-containing protein n=1 Tax=Nocardia sp. NBC_00416 TaxID=2975991 RepID=UPI002E23897C
MVTLSVRHVPDAVYRALRVRAVNHGRSTEAEILAILEDVVTRAPERARLGSVLAGERPDDDWESSGPHAPPDAR